MALDELNDKLHSRDFHADRVRHSTVFDPQNTPSNSDGELPVLNQTETWRDPGERVEKVQESLAPRTSNKKYVKILVIALSTITLIAIALGIAMQVRSSLFSEEKIKVSFSGLSDVSSAEQVTYIFEYNNDNFSSLKDTIVIFEYPETFRPDAAPDLTISASRAEKKTGEIASHGQGKITLSGKFYGYRGDRSVLSATLRYNPSSLSSTFEKRATKEVHVASSPLFFEITAPTELASEQEVQYEIHYGNNGASDFPNLRIKLDYPEGFTFTDADPRPSDGNAVWSLETLRPRAEGKIVVRGRLSGERDQQKVIHGGIGFFQGDGKFAAYSDHERRTRVVASPFSITQTVNDAVRGGSASAGDTVSYRVQYKNEGNVGVRDAILTVEIDSPYLDFGTLRFLEGGRGAYIQSRKVISWKASDMPALARVEPGQGGVAVFALKTYDNLKERFPDARELSFQAVAKIDSPDIPAIVGVTKVVASSSVLVKINTRVTAELQVLYQDAVIENSGPYPLVAGQETTFTVHYSLTNTLNNVENGRVSILLPTGIRYTGKRTPENEKMTFNERSNEFTWDVGMLEPGKKRELVFQVATLSNAIGNEGVTLVSRATFTGKDMFTGRDVRMESDSKTSNNL